ncbi:hypothetical protein, partial [uncultured Bacteroides sp.]|uniref:hypothetical protein n=1 Tax=uncultured Bacteroides sp. TaxID=162156 RepID=UPI00262628BA
MMKKKHSFQKRKARFFLKKYLEEKKKRAMPIISVIKTGFIAPCPCKFQESPYICNVFFIVLDLRLTKVGVQRY